jgi:hypothetical protein
MSDFSPLSRYAGIATTTLELADGEAIIYLRRRFVPAPERFALLQLHEVREGERIDQVAAHNRAMRPEQLVEQPGRQLRITLPEGIPGAPDA